MHYCLCVDTAKVNKQIAEAAEHAKIAGNSAFTGGEFKDAIEHYTCCYQLALTIPNNQRQVATALTNRAQAYISLGEHDVAMTDAKQSVHIDSSWAKVHVWFEVSQYLYSTLLN